MFSLSPRKGEINAPTLQDLTISPLLDFSATCEESAVWQPARSIVRIGPLVDRLSEQLADVRRPTKTRYHLARLSAPSTSAVAA